MTLEIRRLNTSQKDFEEQFNELLAWDNREDPAIATEAHKIVDSVRSEGDEALLRFTRKLDRRAISDPSELELPLDRLAQAWDQLPHSDRQFLELSANRIQTYHEQDLPKNVEYTDDLGNQLSSRSSPVGRVGVYVPGGQASYPSTALMTLIPARIAGVPERIVAVPLPNDEISEHLLAALHIAQPTQVFGIGGAQAIGALAFGTETVPKVDKIVGPGGSWVAAAKKYVFGPVGIDSIAGPSEILIVADGSIDPKWTAWDLMSQAEHDAAAQALLICRSGQYIMQVLNHIEDHLTVSPRANIIRKSLKQRGAVIETESLDEAIDLANRIAPEHLQLALQDPESYLSAIKHAGAIFLGGYSSEVLGDYIAGPSHVLPTFGTARYASVLGVQDFIKRSSVINISKQGAESLGPAASQFAGVENLSAHAEAAKIRSARS